MSAAKARRLPPLTRMAGDAEREALGEIVPLLRRRIDAGPGRRAVARPRVQRHHPRPRPDPGDRVINWTVLDIDGVEHRYSAAPHDALEALDLYAAFEAAQIARVSGQTVSYAWMRPMLLGAAPGRFAVRDGKPLDEVTFREVFAGRNMIELERAAEGRAKAEGFSDSATARISDAIAAVVRVKAATQPKPATP